jgi:hypothetical protein
MSKTAGISAAVLLVLCASSALAMDPAIKCQTQKLKAAAKYTACRLQAEADAARHFASPDFSTCDAIFAADWHKAEVRALAQGTPCWTTGDGTAVQADITAQTDALSDALAGGTGK